MKKTNTNVISIDGARDFRTARQLDPHYAKRIEGMSKIELLDEMVRYQEERSRIGKLTPLLMYRGKILFKRLEENAETEALRALSRSYRRHLKYEMRDYILNEENDA